MSDIPEAVPASAAGSAPAIAVKHRGLITLSIMAATPSPMSPCPR